MGDMKCDNCNEWFEDEKMECYSSDVGGLVVLCESCSPNSGDKNK